jgi:hypothetical protein
MIRSRKNSLCVCVNFLRQPRGFLNEFSASRKKGRATLRANKPGNVDPPRPAPGPTASGSGDFTVRLWDTAPLRTRYQARREAAALRREAERLVEQLWREKNDPKVVEALRADQALSESLRQTALRAVQRRAQPQEAALANPHDAP